MGKKKNNKNKGRPSWENSLAKAQLHALTPMIQQEAAKIEYRLERKLIASFADILTHQRVFQDLLYEKFNISETEFADRIAQKEDESWNLVESSVPAKKGDHLRITLQGRIDTDTEFREKRQIRIPTLGKEPFTSRKEIEEALVGRQKRDVFEVPITQITKVKNKKGELEDQKTVYCFQITVDRISVPQNPPPVEEKKKGEEANAQ